MIKQCLLQTSVVLVVAGDPGRLFESLKKHSHTNEASSAAAAVYIQAKPKKVKEKSVRHHHYIISLKILL